MSEWKEVTINDIAVTITDFVANGSFASLKENVEYKRVSDYARLIRLVDHRNHYSEDAVYVDRNAFLFLKKSQVFPGDIIISNVGEYSGTVFIVPDLGVNMTLGPNSILVRFGDSNMYMYYWLKSQIGQSTIDSIKTGSANPKFNKTDFKKIKLSLPPLPEQKAIASVLSSLDDKIDLLHRQNKTLEAMAEALFRQWFVEPCKDGLPEGWREGKLPDEFYFTMGQSPVGSSFNEDKIGIPMFQGNADFSFRFPSERVYTTEPTRFAEPLDTLVSVRAPVGEQNMALVKCCIGRGVAAFRYNSDKDYYTYTYFKIRSLMTEIKQFNDEGTVFGSIGKADFEALDINIPPQAIIYNFEKTAKPINDRIIENCMHIRTLEKLRDTLLPKLISGEVRVAV